jgi:PKD repeat protein
VYSKFTAHWNVPTSPHDTTIGLPVSVWNGLYYCEQGNIRTTLIQPVLTWNFPIRNTWNMLTWYVWTNTTTESPGFSGDNFYNSNSSIVYGDSQIFTGDTIEGDIEINSQGYDAVGRITNLGPSGGGSSTLRLVHTHDPEWNTNLPVYGQIVLENGWKSPQYIFLQKYPTNLTEPVKVIPFALNDRNGNSILQSTFATNFINSKWYQNNFTEYQNLTVFNRWPKDIILVNNPNRVNPPVTDFSANVPYSVVPLVTFHDDSTGFPFLWLWDFGDGEISYDQNPTHLYILPGYYTVNLTTWNAGGSDPSIKTDFIHIVYFFIIPQISVNTQSGTAPLPVQFTSDTIAMENDIQAYNWNFGDDDTTNSTQENPLHTYHNTGTYSVSLSVQNSTGYWNTTTQTNYITVLDSPPHADFTATPVKRPAGAPLKVRFTDTSTNFPDEWSWTFGDGNITNATMKNPVHTFYSNGTYTVSLTAWNYTNGNQTIKKPNYITVGPLFALTVGADTVVIFNSTGSTKWAPPSGVTKVDYLVVAGGGAGGNGSYDSGYNLAGGGGGAGGVLNGSAYPVVGNQTVIVGAGGSGGSGECGAKGFNSSFGNITSNKTATGGGGGGGSGCAGSGGGSGGGGAGAGNSGGTGTAGQGNAGGTGIFFGTTGNPGAGGGGAGAAGGTPSAYTAGGNGGDGRLIGITGEAKYYGGGGGGGIASLDAVAGLGGLGCGGNGSLGTANSATCNETGGGGGGAGGGTGDGSYTHGAGGSGVVIIRYQTPDTTPGASFNATPRAGPVNLTVRFTDTSTGNPTSWSWDFGDGNMTGRTEQHPVHFYNTAGTFTVGLTATNSDGSNTTTKEGYIDIGSTDDAGVFRPGNHKFILKNGTDTKNVIWGLGNDTPVSGDWNGDGHSEVGVFRNSTHMFILQNGTATTTVNFGYSNETPVTGDWNGDGLWDVGVFRNWTPQTKFMLKNGTAITSVVLGNKTDLPVTGDWNGDGMGDVGVFCPSNHTFLLKNGSVTTTVNFGYSNETPVSGDWNGDGLWDVGTFRNWSANAKFMLKNGSETTSVVWGQKTDKPVTGKW